MGETKTVHLADDDEDDRMLIKDALEEANPNVNVIEAENGQELIRNIRSADDLSNTVAIVDMNMPKMNGIEAMKELRSEPRTVELPAVILSTSNNPESRKRAIAAGADEYIVKPNSFMALVEIAKGILKNFFARS